MLAHRITDASAQISSETHLEQFPLPAETVAVFARPNRCGHLRISKPVAAAFPMSSSAA